MEADPRVARWAYAEAYAAIDQQPKHLGIGLGPHAVSDASRAQHLHGLTNHIRTSNLPGMRHEPKPSFARTLNQADEGRCRDRLVADKADADHSFSGQGDLERSFIGCGRPAADKLNQPGDLNAELPGDRFAAAHDTINPSIGCVEAGVEADLGVGDVLGLLIGSPYSNTDRGSKLWPWSPCTG